MNHHDPPGRPLPPGFSERTGKRELIPTISQVCSMHSDFATDIAEYAAGGFKSVEIWLTKLEAYLETHSVEDVRSLLREHEVACPAASFQGGLLQTAGPAFDECFNHFKQRLELCVQLAIPTLVVSCDLPGPLGQDALDELPGRLEQLNETAEAAGVKIALEFAPESAFCNNLRTLALLLLEARVSHLGICLDTLHFERSSSKESDLALLNASNLLHVQVCDSDADFRELTSNASRILPGDGRFELDRLMTCLHELNYRGAISVELQNPTIWGIPPRQTAEACLSALTRTIGG